MFIVPDLTVSGVLMWHALHMCPAQVDCLDYSSLGYGAHCPITSPKVPCERCWKWIPRTRQRCSDTRWKAVGQEDRPRERERERERPARVSNVARWKARHRPWHEAMHVPTSDLGVYFNPACFSLCHTTWHNNWDSAMLLPASLAQECHTLSFFEAIVAESWTIAICFLWSGSKFRQTHVWSARSSLSRIRYLLDADKLSRLAVIALSCTCRPWLYCAQSQPCTALHHNLK